MATPDRPDPSAPQQPPEISGSVPPLTPAWDRFLAVGIACLWLWTGLAVLHPHYMVVGGPYLARLGLPLWLAPAACAGEVVLGLWVLLAPPSRLRTGLQLGAVAFFTLALAVPTPSLLVHPFGLLTKNLPFCALVTTRLLAHEEGWSQRTRRILRLGVGLIWITEGLLPKIFFQQEWERQVVVQSGLVPMDPGLFLIGMGLAQALSGCLVLAGEGRAERVMLAGQALALVVLPILVSWQDPLLWFHPFAPLVKNAPILAGTVVLLCRPWSRSA